jgi:hypothetical protein
VCSGVRAELKGLDTPDAEVMDLRSYVPEDSTHFGLEVTATIGPAGGEGEELFYFHVCSASWLRDDPLRKGLAFLRNTLLLACWDADLVERAIADLCRRTEGEGWHEVAQKLSRYGRWEFEDYRE